MSREVPDPAPHYLRLRPRFTHHPLGFVVAAVYLASAGALTVVALLTHAASDVLTAVILADVVVWALYQKWLGEVAVGRNGIRWRTGRRTCFVPVEMIDFVTIAWQRRVFVRCAVPVIARADQPGRGVSLAPLTVLPTRRSLEYLSKQVWAANRALDRPPQHGMSFVATALADRYKPR